jgi:uncharacterized Tic20 family protein
MRGGRVMVVVVGSFVGALALTCIAGNRAAKGLDDRMPLAIRFLR